MKLLGSCFDPFDQVPLAAEVEEEPVAPPEPAKEDPAKGWENLGSIYHVLLKEILLEETFIWMCLIIR